MRRILGGVFVVLLSLPWVSWAGVSADIREDLIREVYTVRADKSYRVEITRKVTLLTPGGVEEGQRDSITFFPDAQRAQLKAAYVVQPNGHRVNVPKHNIFTRPSSASRAAPGFTNSLTTTIVFPQLTPGSQVVSQWEIDNAKPERFGFNLVTLPDFDSFIKKQEIVINAPAFLKMHWRKRGAYHVRDQKRGRRRLITATLKNIPPHKLEPHMVSVKDVAPIFVVSTLPSWEAIGKAYWHGSKDKAYLTPDIRQLAKHIVGKRKGREAAKALYDWVAKNIHYVAVYLNDAAGYVPHRATQIVRNGFGDCKDHVTLLQTLLRAVGIKSEAVLVGWDASYKALPLWSPEQFNHVILYVPQFKLYLNPTSPYTPFGYLDPRLSNKFVVHAVKHPYSARTPHGHATVNRYVSEAKITLLPSGEIKGRGQSEFFGALGEYVRNILSTNEAKARLADDMLATTELGGFGEIKAPKSNKLTDHLVIHSQWHSPHAYQMGDAIYFKTPTGVDFRNAFMLRDYLTSGERQYPMMLRGQTLTWRYQVRLPAGYTLKTLPNGVALKNAAGEYHSHYARSQKGFEVERTLVIGKDYYAADEYPTFETLVYAAINDTRQVLPIIKE